MGSGLCWCLLCCGSVQELFKWLQDNQIVQRLLRTGLHHKQYMSEVGACMLAATLRVCVQPSRQHGIPYAACACGS